MQVSLACAILRRVCARFDYPLSRVPRSVFLSITIIHRGGAEDDNNAPNFVNSAAVRKIAAFSFGLAQSLS
jgi:hypothetical protein